MDNPLELLEWQSWWSIASNRKMVKEEFEGAPFAYVLYL